MGKLAGLLGPLLLAGLVLDVVPAKADDVFYADDIKAATRRYISQHQDQNGLFSIEDRVVGTTLTLRFVKIHDPVRVIDGNRYFACTDFAVPGEPDKLYDLDFWLRPEDGKLTVYEDRVHKEPRRSALWGWYKHPRYTFVNDEVVPLYE
ncbi:hypothetical protein R0135_14055 [Congregibacter variabilis]|uniref:Uncharacterized protein n=1 Tax=Congregibacter variabilis TaxID=3081200 RepID=A0ABZ0I1G5_9GAMM|nr:hypothetical protein R0135_14055 [Congregibacter sp. IMCC43200]